MGITGKRLIFLMLSVCFLILPGLAVDKKTAADIDREIEKIRADLIKIRRFIHMNPRLPGDEGETAKLISGRLQSLGLEVRNGSGKAGVVGLLRGNLPGAWIALRAGLEADPVQETADVPFKSLNPGIMHASGHDIQATIALGAAMVLSAFKDQLRGGVKFIFQPGTPESAATDEGGAALMIKEGRPRQSARRRRLRAGPVHRRPGTGVPGVGPVPGLFRLVPRPWSAAARRRHLPPKAPTRWSWPPMSSPPCRRSSTG